MDFTTALTTLDTELGDGDDFTFTDAEKTRALTRAWNDNFVIEETWDSSLTYLNTTDAYALPTGVKRVYSYWQDTDEDGFKDEIPRGAFEIRAGNIYVLEQFKSLLTHNKTLFLWGPKKLTTSDSITGADLQEYVLMLAQYYTLNLLTNQKVNRFIRNDTTMGELLALRRQLEREVAKYRQQMRRVSVEM